MLDFTGQVVLVTGAGGNLGLAACEIVSRLGASVALADYKKESVEASIEKLKGGRVAAICGHDARTREGAARIVADAVSAFGRVDALINTVGTFQLAPVAGGAVDQWTALMDLNAKSALLLSESVLSPMTAQGYGRIVHVAAGAGFKSFAGAAAYAASKAALLRITEAIAEEHKLDGITANCVVPSMIDTPQNRATMPDADFGRWTPPAEIAAVMAFLASRQSSAITGAAIPVPGRL